MASTPYIPSITVDQVIAQLISFLQPFVGNVGAAPDYTITPNVPTQIIRGQQNRTNPPQGPFVKVTEINRKNLDTPTFTNSAVVDVQQASVANTKQLDVQIDFYGSDAGDWAAAIETIWRSAYAADQFPAGMAPLFCSDAHQGPLITGEQQYEFRWVITGSLEYNPSVIIPQQSATVLKTNVFEDLP
jgi:hypothetical protein